MDGLLQTIELDPIIQVEQALLGGLLMNPKRAIPLLPAGFSPTHYLDEEHRAIHEVIIAQGDGATAITVGHALGATGDLKKFLVDIVVASPGWMATDTAAIAVLDAFQRRELSAIGGNLVEQAKNTSPSQMSGAAIAATAVSLRIPTDPSRAFRRKPAGDSDRSQPPIPRHPSHP